MVEAGLLGVVCEQFALGALVGVRAELHGGVNRLLHVETSSGHYGVHQLLGIPVEVDAIDRCERILGLELAALHAGVRLPRPVRTHGGAAALTLEGQAGVVTVHEWYDAAQVDDSVRCLSLARSLGWSVGQLHALSIPPTPLPGDVLARRLSMHDWLDLAAQARSRGLPWADLLGGAAAELGRAADRLDEIAHASSVRSVWSHRDLTSMNVLADENVAVLLDWESSGPVLTSAEVGRTALDHFSVEGGLDHDLVAAFLGGYADAAELPALGPDWCWLWIHGCLVFAEQCARSCIAGLAPPSLLALQSSVVEMIPSEVARRLAIVDALVGQFDKVIEEIRDRAGPPRGTGLEGA